MPDVHPGAVGDPSAARQRLELALQKGSVRADVFGDPYGLDPDRQERLIINSIADGIQGLDADFSVERDKTEPAPKLVVILNPAVIPSSLRTCEAPEQIRTGPAQDSLLILAAFCDGEKLIYTASGDHAVTGPTDPDLKRLLWRVGAVLFPDDYEQSYGVDLIPGVNLGIGGSFGF